MGAPKKRTPPTQRTPPSAGEVKRIGPRLDRHTAEALALAHETLNAGAEYVLEAWPTLISRALGEVRGRFGASEARLILDVLNGTLLTAGLAGQHLPLAVADGIALDHLDRKWEVDGAALRATVDGLTSYQCAAVEWWAASFWRGEYSDETFERDHLARVTGDEQRA